MQAHLATALFLAASSLLALSACSAEEQTSSPIVLSEEMALRPGEAPPPPSLLIPVIPDVVDLQATDGAEENWLSECLGDGEGSLLADANCYSRHQELLESTQAHLLQDIRTALSEPGPQDTDYAAATRLLEASQRDWKSYIDADCEIVSKVFGDGNEQGLAGGECVIGHLRRSEQKAKRIKAVVSWRLIGFFKGVTHARTGVRVDFLDID